MRTRSAKPGSVKGKVAAGYMHCQEPFRGLKNLLTLWHFFQSSNRQSYDESQRSKESPRDTSNLAHLREQT